jgi:hypothetical protein
MTALAAERLAASLVCPWCRAKNCAAVWQLPHRWVCENCSLDDQPVNFR